MRKPRPSEIAWGTLAAGIAVYDYLSPDGETLSEQCDRWIEKPLGRAALVACVGTVALHLVNMIPNPDRYDPLHRLTKRRKRNERNG